ncbi:MAG: hypothetical protein KBA51_01160 [Kiritimatiellae bacterium]|nr:hypothetical protein [Kiritimatiellia bacterium]
MKIIKMLVVVSCLMLAGVAHADVAILWSSTTYFLLAGGDPMDYPADYVPADTLRLLIWSASAPPAVDYAKAGTGIGDGEYILWSSVADPVRPGDNVYDSGRFNFSGTAIIKDNSAVGGNNINSGYIYSRIFSSSVPVAGQYYFQSLTALGPMLADYDPLVPGSTLDHVTSAVPNLELVDTNNPTAQNGMYTVVPEPGSLLLAFPVLGVMAVRRMRRRD